MPQTQADQILNTVYTSLGISNSTDSQKYNRIDDIVNELQSINRTRPINVKTTGTISERLCELCIKSSVPATIYGTLGRDWKWVGDFYILGNPFNLIISVKSFKAKERLMASGSGNVLSPTIGWGLFDDINEWTVARVKGYLYRAFIAIYIPSNLYNQLTPQAKKIKNTNNKNFLRKIDNFSNDLRRALNRNSKIDMTKI